MIDSSVPRRRDVELRLGQGEDEFLATLDAWRSLGLMTEYELRQFCSTSLSCPLQFSLPTRLDSPNLLAGLELWLRQGVLADADVLAWCAGHLCSPLPEVMAPISVAVSPTPAPCKTRPKFGGVPTVLQALMDEISVLWLLFLGVFLVVVSSAVLAASQWNSVPPAGQYGILWSYTFVFWFVSHWLGRRENLQLTAHTLQLTALLIIPVNFWMIDSFQLVQGGLSLLVALVAGVVLSGLMAYTLNPRDSERWGKGGWFVFLNFLLLSWLHWGWKDLWVAPVAIYVGIVVTGICTMLSGREWLDQVRARPPNRYSFVALLGFTPLYGMLLLLFRGLWIEQLDYAPLGLAFGLVGGIFCWTGRRQSFGARAWWFAGFSFLIFGRLTTQEFGTHWQAVLITAIALYFLWDLFLRSWKPWLVWVIFIAGFQGLVLLYMLVPDSIHELSLDWLKSFAGAKGAGGAKLGFMFLPYWWLTLSGVDFLRRRRGQLVPLVERIALGYGGLLTLLTLGNSCLRCIFLIAIGVTLWLRFGPKPSTLLVYLFHGVVLGAIASGVDFLFPSLAVDHWAMLCLVAMVGEFALYAYGDVRWRESAWLNGLLLAMTAYLCLLVMSPYSETIDGVRSPIGTMATWLIPASFTMLGYRSLPRSSGAQWIGLVSVFAVQLLCFPSTLLRTAGFALAVVVMFLLSRQMRRFFPVASTIGFCLAFVLNAVYSYAPNPDDWLWVSLPLCSLAVGLVAFGLRNTRVGLAVMYRRASYLWSYFLNLVLTGVMAVLAWLSLIELDSIQLSIQMGAVLMAIAVLFQFWLSPRIPLLYVGAVSVEAAIILVSWLSPWPHEVMATATFVAGIISLVIYRFPSRLADRHWMVVPILFAIAAWLLGHYDFLAHTGLYTMGSALILLWVGRRAEPWRALTYVGIAGFSFGIYELLVYQILQAEGEHPGDALILFAGLATLIMMGDRLFARKLTRVLRLSSNQFLPVAHLHWLAASLFLLTALVAPMRVWAEVSWIVLLLILAAYAMVAGRVQTGFLYAGVAQGLGAIAFGMAQIIPLSTLGYWGGAIAVGFAACLYYFPWSRYGWDRLPEQRMAMILPVGVVFLSLSNVALASVLVVGAWYFWISQRPNLLRLSYLGLVFGNWAVYRLVERWWTVTPMWMAIMVSCSLLLVIQWEPVLQSPQRREVRHWLRCVALTLIALVAFVESEGYFFWSLVTVGAGLGMGVIGLVFQVRSFLYVGTILFLVKILGLLWAFVADHSFLLWALGIVLGIILIWVAATFESRRSQAIAFLDYWADALEKWQ